jgi:hypothetical protein
VFVVRGLSRPKDGVATLAYDPRIHEATQRLRPYGSYLLRFIMGCRVKLGHSRPKDGVATLAYDEREICQVAKKQMAGARPGHQNQPMDFAYLLFLRRRTTTSMRAIS